MARQLIEISDKEISPFVVTLIMPLLAFAFKGEFSLKDMVRVIVHACSCMISIEKTANKILQGLANSVFPYHGKPKNFLGKVTFIVTCNIPKVDLVTEYSYVWDIISIYSLAFHPFG